MHGFSLHANTHIPAHRRDQLERLIRYTARGSVSLERLEEEATGDLIYTFTTPWSDGTTGIKLSPVELLEKRAARVPPHYATRWLRRRYACLSTCHGARGLPWAMYESRSFLSGHAEYLSHRNGMPDAMQSALFFVGNLCHLSPDQRGDASLAEGLR